MCGYCLIAAVLTTISCFSGIGSRVDGYHVGLAVPLVVEAVSGGDEEILRYFTDLPVITHEANEARFYSDLPKNKRVVTSSPM